MGANTTIFIISDIHLGGESGAGDTAGFQLCPRANRERLAQFLNWVTAEQRTGLQTHLVINGDLVDFLAEQKFSPFTSNEAEARQKLQRIIDHSSEVWEALEAASSAGVRITILLGNHDLEMSFRAPRDLLLESIGPGRVEFLYDNEALAIGPVLIEHGNRYDKWNLVSHDRLREIRSALSRREQPPDMQIPPGSRLVATVLNKLKERFSFVDLLKPENEGVLPFLGWLDIKLLPELRKLAPLYQEAARADFDGEGRCGPA
jgi:UDP-2,3-diacylglucosamine pyrophosphatase LpxH